jgi:hypothetical protein
MWEWMNSLINKWGIIFLVEFKINYIMPLRLKKDAVFNCEIHVHLLGFLWQVRYKDLEWALANRGNYWAYFCGLLTDQQMHFGFMDVVFLHSDHQYVSTNHVAIFRAVRTIYK